MDTVRHKIMIEFIVENEAHNNADLIAVSEHVIREGFVEKLKMRPIIFTKACGEILNAS